MLQKFLLQKRPEYDQPPKDCTYGCGQTYRETEDEHWRVFHQKKTWALICGCGFGDIMANRFRIHLEKAHGQIYSVEEVADEFFFHDVPAYTTLKPCFSEKYKGHCKFRTPFYNLLTQSHRCEEGLKYSKPPKPTAFFDFLPPSQRPTWGYPHEDRLEKKKPANTVKSAVTRANHADRQPPAKQRKSDENLAIQAAPPERKRRLSPVRKSQLSKSASELSRPQAASAANKHNVVNVVRKAKSPDLDLDEAAILNADNEPEIFAPGELDEEIPEHAPPSSDGEVATEDEETIPMEIDTGRPSSSSASASNQPIWTGSQQRAKQIADQVDFPDLSAANPANSPPKPARPAKRHHEWGPLPPKMAFQPIIHEVASSKVPPMPLDASSYDDFYKLAGLPEFHIHAGTIMYNSRLIKPATCQRVAVKQPLQLGRYFVLNRQGKICGYATCTRHWSSQYLVDSEERFCQFNPSNFGAVAEMYDVRTRPASMSHFLCLSTRFNPGEYRLLVAPVEAKPVMLEMYVCEADSHFGSTVHVMKSKGG